MRPPRNGPTLRQTSPESNSGLMGVAATEMAATVMAATVKEIACFVFIAVLDGEEVGGLIWPERLALVMSSQNRPLNRLENSYAKG